MNLQLEFIRQQNHLAGFDREVITTLVKLVVEEYLKEIDKGIYIEEGDKDTGLAFIYRVTRRLI